MTTIIAVKNEPGVTFGWDSQTSEGDRPLVRKQMKVFPNSGMVIGVAGNVRISDVVRYLDFPAREALTHEYMVRDFVPTLMGALESAGALNTELNHRGFDGELLVSDGESIFKVAPDGAVIEEDSEVHAIGSGSPYALATLNWETRSPLMALMFAERMDTGTGGPFYVKTVEEILND